MMTEERKNTFKVCGEADAPHTYQGPMPKRKEVHAGKTLGGEADRKTEEAQKIIDACEILSSDFSESVHEEMFWDELSDKALRGYNPRITSGECGPDSPQEAIPLPFKGDLSRIDSVRRGDYEELKASGMLWEFYPTAPNEWPTGVTEITEAIGDPGAELNLLYSPQETIEKREEQTMKEKKELSPFLPLISKWEYHIENQVWYTVVNNELLLMNDNIDKWTRNGLLPPNEGGGFQKHTPGDPMPCDGGLKVELRYKDSDMIEPPAFARAYAWDYKCFPWDGWRPHFANSEREEPTTVKGWLETLPGGYRELALANYDPDFTFDDDDYADGMLIALSKAFYWMTAPEGDVFWDRVRAHYAQNHNLPTLPNPRTTSDECKTDSPQDTIPLPFKGDLSRIHSVSRWEHEELKASGMLWEFYPTAPNEWPTCTTGITDAIGDPSAELNLAHSQQETIEKREEQTMNEEKELSPYLPEGYEWKYDGTIWIAGDIATLDYFAFKHSAKAWNNHGLLHPIEGGGFQKHTPGDPMPFGVDEFVQCLWADGEITGTNVKSTCDRETLESPSMRGWRPYLQFENNEREEPEANPATDPFFKESVCYKHLSGNVYACRYYDIELVLVHQASYEIIGCSDCNPKEFTPCNPDGSPIAPEPAVGQVWEDEVHNGYMLNSLTDPEGDSWYVAIGCQGEYANAPEMSLQEAVEDLTFVREGEVDG